MPRIVYDVGGVRFEPQNLRLTGPAGEVPLAGRATETLLALVGRPGQLVTKDDLMAAVWADAAVEDNNLAQQIATVRRGLEAQGLPDAIETVPRQGYRLRTRVRIIDDDDGLSTMRARSDDENVGSTTVRRAAPIRAAVVIMPAALALAIAAMTGLGPAQRWAGQTLDASEGRASLARGQQLLREGNARGAVAELQHAIARDPENARAHGALAHALGRLGSTPSSSSYRPAGASPSVAAAARSVEIDPTCADCHGTLGMFLFYHDWRWDESEAHYREALRLAPEDAGIHASYAMLLTATGRHDEALSAIDFALARQPYQVTWLGIRANALYFARRYDEAVTAADQALVVANKDSGAWEARSRALFMLNRWEEAITALAQERFESRSTELDQAVRAGGAEAGVRLLLSFTDDWRGRVEHSWRRGPWRALLGDVEGALDEVERAYQARRLNAIYLGIDPAYDVLRDHPRFRAVLDGMGLTPVLARANAPVALQR